MMSLIGLVHGNIACLMAACVAGKNFWFRALFSAAPDRRNDFARLSLRGLVHGIIACLMTACVAGKNIGSELCSLPHLTGRMISHVCHLEVLSMETLPVLWQPV